MGHRGDLTLTTATQRIRPDFRKNRLLQILLAWYVLLWVTLAVRPLYRQDWFLENLLVIPFFVLLVSTYRLFPFSNLSYLLITLFMSLHAVGAHYTYAEVPFGFWLQGVFSFSRNHFDRIVHFAFGLFMAYPARELFFRVAHSRGFWAYYLPIGDGRRADRQPRAGGCLPGYPGGHLGCPEGHARRDGGCRRRHGGDQRPAQHLQEEKKGSLTDKIL